MEFWAPGALGKVSKGFATTWSQRGFGRTSSITRQQSVWRHPGGFHRAMFLNLSANWPRWLYAALSHIPSAISFCSNTELSVPSSPVDCHANLRPVVNAKACYLC